MKKRMLATVLMVASMSIGSTMMVSAAEVTTPEQTYITDVENQAVSDLDYFQGNVMLENRVMEIYQYAQDLRAQGYSSEQIEENINALLEIETYTDLDGYISGYLNSQEQALYDQNPAKGLLCMANGKLALGYAQDNYSSGLTDGNGDAFRHTL